MTNDAILLLDKKSGETSFASLYPVKRFFKGSKVGHTGTLDKFASGLMVVLTGHATRLSPVFSGLDKEYEAEILFGKETTTLDPEGEVVATGPIPERTALEAVLASFIGEQEQVPPIYSAIHIDGKRAYKSARNGEEVEMPSRRITVYASELLSFEGDKARVRFAVSKGTYIRSLARDIGKRLGTAASLSALRRTAVGPYTLNDVTGLEKAPEHFIPLLKRLGNIHSLSFSPENLKIVQNGYLSQRMVISSSSSDEGYYLCSCDAELIALAEKCQDGYHIVTGLNL